MGVRRDKIVRARRGAVLAEFAIAFMPICTMFLCLSQLSRYFIARLAVMHAAEVSVRACAVIQEPMPGHTQGVDGKDSEVQTAADMVMKPSTTTAPWSGFAGTELTYDPPTCNHVNNGNSNGDPDTATINATYTCTIPVAKNIVCSSGPKKFTMTSSFPHQGADYHLSSETGSD